MRLVWLSHVLDISTPLYGGEDKVIFHIGKSMANGDSCNTSVLELPSHGGTHVDAPRHFIPDGKAVSDFPAESWVFEAPVLIKLPMKTGELIVPEMLSRLEKIGKAIDLLLIRTDFESYRGNEIFWKNSPGFSEGAAVYLKERIPTLRAVGVDCISISSLVHREAGRAAHQCFLKGNILLFEDLCLSNIEPDNRLSRVVALPLRFKNGDGAPCTIIAWVDDD